MAMCPECLTHFQISGTALTTTACPFCETTLGISRTTPREEQGRAALQRLGKSRSGSMLAALGVSLSLAACQQKPADSAQAEPVTPVVEKPSEPASSKPPTLEEPPARVDMGTALEPSADLGEAVKIAHPKATPPVQEYGAVPVDAFPEYDTDAVIAPSEKKPEE